MAATPRSKNVPGSGVALAPLTAMLSSENPCPSSTIVRLLRLVNEGSTAIVVYVGVRLMLVVTVPPPASWPVSVMVPLPPVRPVAPRNCWIENGCESTDVILTVVLEIARRRDDPSSLNDANGPGPMNQPPEKLKLKLSLTMGLPKFWLMMSSKSITVPL